MYHILAAQCQGQYGARRPAMPSPCRSLPSRIAADAPGLVELAVAVGAGIGGVEQQVELARCAPRSRSCSAPVSSVPERDFEPEPVERVALRARLRSRSGRSSGIAIGAGLERAGQRALELALGDRRLELGARRRRSRRRGPAPWRGHRAAPRRRATSASRISPPRGTSPKDARADRHLPRRGGSSQRPPPAIRPLREQRLSRMRGAV